MWARIENDSVAEVTTIDPVGRFHESLMWRACGPAVRPGWSYFDSKFLEPVAAPSPQLQLSCTPAQGLVALFVLKQITEEDVLSAIGQIADPVQQYTTRIGYQRATTWELESPAMKAVAQLFGLTDTDLLELFTYAITVQV